MSKKHEVTAFAYDKRGRLIAVGRNSYTKTHPLQGHYAKKAGKPAAVYLHAEIAAMVKARSQIHKLVIVRYDAAGNPVLSKPCASCQLAIKAFNIKIVEHT